MSRIKLTKEFYERDTITVAKELLGKYIVRNIDGKRLVAKITETEAYCGEDDKACHAYGGKITHRTKTIYSKGGTAYVYLIYGMYDCFNVVSEKEGVAGAVLIRAVEATEGIDQIADNRFGKPCSEFTSYQKKNFLNGPGKLCRGLKITRSDNGIYLDSHDLYIYEDTEETPPSFGEGKRINIDYAGEDVDRLWRFFVL